MTYVVAVYMTDREYGGAEEGGWWYDTGDIVRTVKTFRNEQKAINYCQRLNSILDKTLNRGRRPTSSVLSTGRYAAEVWDNHAPRFYPERHPHYE